MKQRIEGEMNKERDKKEKRGERERGTLLDNRFRDIVLLHVKHTYLLHK